MQTDGDIALTLDELREALEARGLTTTGSFKDLEERLVDAVAAEEAAVAEAVAQMDVNGMSVKELKDLISKACLSHADCLDKNDLRTRALEAANALAAAQATHLPKAQATSSAEAVPTPDTSAADPQLVSQVESLPLRDWRGLITESGLSYDDCTDKSELLERACQALSRLLMPGAHRGPISKGLVEAAAQREEAAKAEAMEAKRALVRQRQEAKAAAEKAAAEAEAAAKKAREKEKRRRKRTEKGQQGGSKGGGCERSGYRPATGGRSGR